MEKSTNSPPSSNMQRQLQSMGKTRRETPPEPGGTETSGPAGPTHTGGGRDPRCRLRAAEGNAPAAPPGEPVSLEPPLGRSRESRLPPALGPRRRACGSPERRPNARLAEAAGSGESVAREVVGPQRRPPREAGEMGPGVGVQPRGSSGSMRSGALTLKRIFSKKEREAPTAFPVGPAHVTGAPGPPARPPYRAPRPRRAAAASLRPAGRSVSALRGPGPTPSARRRRRAPPAPPSLAPGRRGQPRGLGRAPPAPAPHPASRPVRLGGGGAGPRPPSPHLRHAPRSPSRGGVGPRGRGSSGSRAPHPDAFGPPPQRPRPAGRRVPPPEPAARPASASSAPPPPAPATPAAGRRGALPRPRARARARRAGGGRSARAAEGAGARRGLACCCPRSARALPGVQRGALGGCPWGAGGLGGWERGVGRDAA